MFLQKMKNSQKEDKQVNNINRNNGTYYLLNSYLNGLMSKAKLASIGRS